MQVVKRRGFQSRIRGFESRTPCQRLTVDVAQLVERTSVERVNAGSIPVIRPKPRRRRSSAW
jgi:hypothetical protein